MKDFFVHRAARGLIIPFAIVLCVLLAGAGSARAAKNAPVEIGFMGAPPPNFQNVLLNVQSVRINPNANAGPGNNNWQKISVPPGIGGASQHAELQIDLNTSQNIPQLFNTAKVRPDNYKVAEIQLDPNNPGTLIPNCPLAPPVGNTADGCINYPIQLNNGAVISTPISGVSPKKGHLTPLILQLTMTINQAPTSPGGAYLVTLALSQVTTSVLGIVTGKVTVNPGSGSATTGNVRKLAVTAEAIGTNTAIAAAPVTNGSFTLELPAAGPPSPSAPFGTLYDLAVAGGGDTYAAQRLLPLTPGGSLSANFTITGNQTLGNITGTITDGCVAKKTPIVGATLQLLKPPDSISKPPAGFCLTSPDQCVTVATANTNNAGDFPLPGSIKTPAEFDNVPVLPKNGSYVVEITAPGYDPSFVLAIPSSNTSSKGGTCSTNGGTTFSACKLTLSTGYISGGIPIIPPPAGQTTLVQVFAEDHDTNNLEGALPMPVSIGSSNAGLVSFTINVPPSIPVGFFDLFATTIDYYQSAVDPYQGHNIVAVSHIPAPAACATTTMPAITDVSQTINCVGHGSITGAVANPNLGTSVVLEKLDPEGPVDDNAVQITNSIVQNQPPNPDASSNYAFCAPADTYQLQKFQLPTPDPSTTPTSMPTSSPDGSPTTATIPPAPHAGGPSPTPTPAIQCPTTCSNPDGSCPGICNNVIVPIP